MAQLLYLFQILLFVFAITTNTVKIKVVAEDQYSEDYEDWNHLKGIGGAIPNFWDLFSDSPQFTDSPQTNEYPNEYVLPPPNQG